MKEWKLCSDLEKIDIINRAVKEGKGNTSLGKEVGCNESTIRKFKKNRCIKENDLFVLRDITDSNIVVIEEVPIDEVVENTNVEENEQVNLSNNNVNMDKLNLLLNNLDSLLNLIPKHKNCIYRSGENKPITLRIDSGLYEELKSRAEISNNTISELLNIVLEKYYNDIT